MIRSSARVPAPATAVGPGFFGFAAALWLATVTPPNHPSEDDVKTAESDSEQRIGKTRWSQRRDGAERQKRHPHHGHHAHGKKAAGGNSRSIKQQPHGRQKLAEAALIKDERQQSSRKNRGRNPKHKTPEGFR